uniref:Retroviral polymerase SH3-like domain-containing protein n=1 Tax=Tanacetum cinerariifolium TaxID=118510 RepID=A0A699HJ85_TANCI|nr:hypothetical protein [Tanacetum cinerariifolium]
MKTSHVSPVVILIIYLMTLRVKRLEREFKARTLPTKIYKVDRGGSRCNIKFRGGLLGIKCSKTFPLLAMVILLLVRFPTASYEDPTASVFCHCMSYDNLHELVRKLVYVPQMGSGLYVEHHRYDHMDYKNSNARDYESFNSSDAYCSSDDEQVIDYVDTYYEGEHDVVVKNITTNDPFLTKLCSNNGNFRGFINEPIPVNEDLHIKDLDSSSLEPRHQIHKEFLVYYGRDLSTGRCAGYFSKKVVGIKSLLDAVGIIVAHVCVNAASENMDQDSTHIVAASKVPMLKPGEYEISRMRIKQYIQMIDYALWEVIENGSTFLKTQVVEGVTTKMPITTAKEKARRILEALKSCESVGALEENLSQEDVNQKLLRSLSPEWNTHVVVWKNKADLDTMSMDDLYNNLKVAQLVHEDLEQIHPDDMKEMDLRWQMAMLAMRARRECGALRNQDNKHKESSRRSVPMETSASTTLVSCDGLRGYDWSYENYNAVPPPYTRNFMPPTPDLSFTGLDKFVNKPVVENCKAKPIEEEPKVVRKNDDAPIIEEWVSDNEEEDVSQPKIKKKIVRPNITKIEFVKSKQQEKNPRKTVKQVEQHRQNTHKTVNTTWYVQNRVLVVKPYNKTPYENFHGRTPTLSFMRPFRCHVTILNTIDHLGKFDGKTDKGFFVRYSLNTKVFRVFNSRTRIVEENLHIRSTRKETKPVKDYILLPLWTVDLPFSQELKSSHDDGSKPSSDDGKKVDEDPRKENECNDQEKEDNVNSANNVNTVSSTVNAAGTNEHNELLFDPNMPTLEDVSIFNFASDDDDGTVVNMNNMDTTIQVSSIPTIRIHKDHPLDQVIRDLQSAIQTRKMSKNLVEHGFVSTIQQRTNHKDIQNCLFACFLSPRRTQKGNSCIERSKLDRSYAGRASTFQVTRSLDFNGFTK